MGTVEQSKSGAEIELEFSIQVPTLDNYTYSVLDAYHQVELYPVRVHDYVNDSVTTAETEEKFVKVLGQILSSQKLRKVIGALMDQVSSES